MLGTHTGSLVHVAGAAFGLSALIVSSAVAFSVVKYAGAAYLIWLGIRRWRAGDRTVAAASASTAPMSSLFRQGVIVQLLNPKTAVFFLAFLPQFVDVDRGSVTMQIVVLGVVFIVLGLMSDGTYQDVSRYDDGTSFVDEGDYESYNGAITFYSATTGETYQGSVSGDVLTQIINNYTQVFERD